jgi:hypothetical protein
MVMQIMLLSQFINVKAKFVLWCSTAPLTACVM